MIFGLIATLAIGFPPLALWAWRTGGTRRIIGIAGGGLATIIALALAAGSSAFGNRLADHEGYWALAPRIVLFGLLCAGLPLITMAVVVGYLGRRVTQGSAVCGAATLAGIVAFVAGVMLAMSLFWR
jgi:hypothetical protein